MNCSLDDDRQIAKLKSMMKPFVHVHKGEILKKTLRWLFHSVLSLKQSDLQKPCFRQLGRFKNGLKLDHLVSIASVHPSLLSSCDQIPDSLKILLKEHRKNVDAGVKIRFLFDLINLAVGEKVLV
ncbi:hypothetical protein RND81_13G038400 [Saponaria officinalis]|uniref:Uncharacterized protein n=1 Tax=Saponaria officinalis TaxID=3572 RepID=A0AAW1GU10_SAPOF